jgi:hypothetical protein
VDWDHRRKNYYFAWAKRVVEGFTAPNAILKVEFEKTLQKFDSVVDTGTAISKGAPRTPIA